MIVSKYTDGPGGTRDASSAGNLRENYESIYTPNTYVPLPGFARPPLELPPRCESCNIILRPEFFGDPVELTSPIASLTTPTLLTIDRTTSQVAAVRAGFAGMLDATTAFTTDALSVMSSPDMAFLAPVETGPRGARRLGDLQWVAMPKTWTVDASITPFLLEDGVFTTNIRRVGLANAASSLTAPTERSAARGILSAVDAALYMIGGTDTDGAPTGELWRFDLQEQTWKELFTATSGRDYQPVHGAPSETGLASPGPRRYRPGEVLALGYDSKRGTMLVLDRVTSTGRSHRRVVRLLKYDVRAQSSTLLAEWPYVAAFDDYGLVALEDGSFILVLSRAHPETWIAFSLRLDSRGHLTWDGVQSGVGQMLQDPFNASASPYLPILRHGDRSLVALQPRRPCGHTPLEM